MILNFAMRATVCVTLCVMHFGADPAAAEPIFGCPLSPCIDFSYNGPSAGTISFGVDSAFPNALIGSGIPVANVDGFFTPENAFPTPGLTVLGGELNFRTGPGGFNSVTGRYEFSGGGFFEITGGVSDSFEGEIALPPGSVLLSGTFTAATFNGLLIEPAGTDGKHESLLDYFGYSSGLPFGFAGFLGVDPLSFEEGLGAQSFEASVLSIDITNQVQVQAIPEPTSLMLLLSGLTGFGLRSRKRLTRGRHVGHSATPTRATIAQHP